MLFLLPLALLGCGDDTETTALRADLDAALATIDAQAQTLSALKDRVAAAEAALEAQDTELSSLQSADDLLNQDVTAAMVELDGVITDVTDLTLDVDSLLTDVGVLQGQVATNTAITTEVEPLLDYLVVDTADHSVVFEGANVFVQSGSGTTDGTINGLGNLIVGYNENSSGTGSHNLVVGKGHTYSSWGGVVFGYDNEVTEARAIVLGGSSNTASGGASVIVGGINNDASGNSAVVLGGGSNEASGFLSTVYGGQYQTASATGSYAP